VVDRDVSAPRFDVPRLSLYDHVARRSVIDIVIANCDVPYPIHRIIIVAALSHCDVSRTAAVIIITANRDILYVTRDIHAVAATCVRQWAAIRDDGGPHHRHGP